MDNFEEEKRGRGFSSRLALLLLFLILLLFFSRQIFTDATYYYSDCHAYLHPMKHFMVESFGRGEFPLWNPYPAGGYPFHGSYAPGVLSPLHLLYAVLPFESAFKYIIILHHLLAALFMFLFLGEWKLGPLPKLCGALMFSLSSFMISQTDLFIPSLGWVPLVLFFFHRGMVNRKLSGAVLAGIALALAFLQGDLQTTYALVFIIPIYGIIIRVKQDDTAKEYYLLLVKSYAFLGLAALTISAAALLPAVPVLLSSGRGGQALDDAGARALRTARLGEFVHFAGFREIQESENLHARGIDEPFVRRLFLGILPLILLAFAIARKKRTAVFILCALLFFLLLSMGKKGGLFTILFYALPGFSIFRYPEKWLGFFMFFLAMGAALGLDLIREKDNDKSGLSLTGAAAAAALVAILLLAFGFEKTNLEALSSNRTHGWFYMVPLLLPVLLLTFLYEKNRIGGKLFLIFLAAVCIGELFVFQWRAMGGEIVSGKIYTSERAKPLGHELAAKDLSGRLIRFPIHTYIANETFEDGLIGKGVPDRQIETEGWRRTYRGNTGAEFGVMTVHGITTFTRPEEYLFWKKAADTGRRRRALDLYSAKYILSRRDAQFVKNDPNYEIVDIYDQEIMLSMNMTALPRAYCVNEVINRKDIQSVAETLFSERFDPRTQAVVSGTGKSISLESGSPAPKTSIVKSEPMRVEIEISGSKAASLLVLTDSYAGGWKAKVDGKEAPIYKANLLFRGVPLPAGAKKVEFCYDPQIFHIGLIISLLGLAGSILAFMLLRHKD